VTSGEALGYICAYLVPSMLFARVPAQVAPMTSMDTAIQTALNVLILAGVVAAYFANGGAAGRDFAGRLLAISWVVGLRTALAGTLIVLVVILAAVASRAGKQEAAPNLRPLIGIVMFGCALVFSWRLSHHLKSLSSTA
jgi:uncharacterized protein (UPF0261 family)